MLTRGRRIAIGGLVAVATVVLVGVASARPGAPSRTSSVTCGSVDVGGKLFIIGHDAPVWSPDGTKVAFVGFPPANCGTGDIYVMDSDGKNQKRLTDTPGNDDLPAWSPDSKKIVFISDRDAPNRTGTLPTEIYVMNADGTAQTRLTQTPGVSEFPARFSPDGTKIVFSRNDHIFVMNADGTNEVQLTNISNRQDRWPDWSPDGKQIVFERTFVEPKLTVINTDGSDAHRLTSTPEFFDEARPAWSPDGKTILYRSTLRSPPIGNSDIYAVNADGTGDRRVTRYSGWDDWPHWSPDSKRIIFSRGPSFLYPEIYVMNADGTGRKDLTSSPSVPRHRIAFLRFRTQPRLPVAGRRFTAVLDVAEIQDVDFGKVTITCRATIGRKVVRLVSKTFAKTGRSRCSWNVPRGTKGKTFRGFIRATSSGSIVPQPFAYRIR